MTEADSESAFVPAGVQNFMEQLHLATGVEPTVARLPARRWCVRLANERVVMTYTGKPVHGNDFQPSSSTLTLDGEPHPVAETFWDFVRFFRDPDRGFVPVAPEPMPPAADIDEAPNVVLRYYDRWTHRFRTGRRPHIQVGRRGDRWTIGVESARVSLQVHFSPVEDGQTEIEVWLIMDGSDYSYEIGTVYGGNLERALDKALARVAERLTPDSGSMQTQPISAEAPAARNTGVEMRRGSVWRI